MPIVLKLSTNHERENMLVVTRVKGEKVYCCGPATLKVVQTKKGKTKLGFKADKNVKVLRGELLTNPKVCDEWTSLRLKRKLQGEIFISGESVITVEQCRGTTIELRIEAARSVKILRGEILEKEKAKAG